MILALTLLACIALAPGNIHAADSSGAPSPVQITHGTAVDSTGMACIQSLDAWQSRDEVEAYVASSPVDPDFVVAAWMLRTPDGPGAMQAAVSRDGGRTWSSPTTLPLGACAGGGADARYVSDPWLSIDKADRIYLSGIEWTPGPDDAPDSVSTLVVVVSNDHGRSWPLRTVVSTRAANGVTLDNTAIVADPDSAGYAWVTATRFGVSAAPAAVARTQDGGRSWTQLQPVPVPGPEAPIALAPQPLLGRDSMRLWLVFGHDPRGAREAFVVSHDAGRSWSKPAPIDAWQRPRHWPKFPGTEDRIEVGSDIVSAGIHRPSGTLWVVHQSARPDSLPTITLLGSKDGGSSWTRSQVFPETEVGWRPTLAVESQGALAVTWFRPDSLRAGDPPPTHPTALELAWLRPTDDGGATGISRQVIDRFDWTPRRNGSWFLGDYHGLTVVRDAALAVYSRPTPEGIRVCAVRVPIPPLAKITGTPDYYWPEVSPDGTQLLYQSPKRSGPIHLMNSDGSNPRLLASGTRVAWFPDGQHVLAVQRSATDARLVVIPLGGAEPDTLPGSYPKLLWRPRPSPDGKTILFGILGEESQPAVFHIVGRDGAKIRELHPSAKGECIGPVWSHDGRIAFVSIHSDSNGNAQSTTLYTMDADGGNEKALAILPGGAQWITWSPHDQFLALQDDIPNGPGEIVIVAAATGHIYRISHPGRSYLDETPSWSSDGWIYFQSNRGGSFALYRMRSDGSQQQLVGQR